MCINPLNCLEAILFHLKYGIAKKEAFDELSGIHFGSPGSGGEAKFTNADQLLYLSYVKAKGKLLPG